MASYKWITDANGEQMPTIIPHQERERLSMDDFPRPMGAQMRTPLGDAAILAVALEGDKLTRLLREIKNSGRGSE